MRRTIANNTYSRLLVCEEALDNCLGYVRARALVDRLIEQTPLDLRARSDTGPVSTIERPDTHVELEKCRASTRSGIDT